MGGWGSGRQPYKYKYTVEDCLSIDIGMMFRGQRPMPGWHATGTLNLTINYRKIDLIEFEINLRLKSPYIRLHYNPIEKIDYKIFLTSTHPNYGGFRYWFSCPKCGKRVWKLYLSLESKYFLCRQCQNLTYTSCRKSHSDDAIIKKISSQTGLSWNQAKKGLLDIRKKYRPEILEIRSRFINGLGFLESLYKNKS
jgi:hypothetical protein